jgi:hypothetical protein
MVAIKIHGRIEKLVMSGLNAGHPRLLRRRWPGQAPAMTNNVLCT